MTHLDKESPNFLIRLPLKENLLSILKAQIHTFLNTTFTNCIPCYFGTFYPLCHLSSSPHAPCHNTISVIVFDFLFWQLNNYEYF